MRDKNIGKIILLLQIFKQVQNLGLDRHIKRGNWFVGHH